MNPTVFRGIEVTAQNWKHISKHAGAYADVTLEAEARFGNGGYKRAAAALLTIPFAYRADTASEANIATNVIGGRYGDHVESEVARVRRLLDHGLTNILFPGVEKNRKMLVSERELSAVAGRAVVTSFASTWGDPTTA